MKKRKYKQFFKEILGVFAYVIWLFLIPASLVYLVDGNSLRIKSCLVVIGMIYTITGFILIEKSANNAAKHNAESRNKRLQELKTQYKYHIELVDKHINITLNKFKNESLSVELDTSHEYIISFSNNVNWICNTRIIGKPDSFIIASCLMYSLINNPVIKINMSDDNKYLKSVEFSINLDIAMSCVFEIISEPSTYFLDNGVWVEEKHNKVNIAVPNGIIKNSELHKRILNTIYRDELSDARTSIMQFSNILHLIYLNCQ